MKKGKFLIPALAMLMCISAGASFAYLKSDEASFITAKAEDAGFINLVVGDNTVPVTEADIAGEGAVIAMFTVQTANTYTFASKDLIITVANEAGTIIDDTVDTGSCTVELAAGVYLIVFVPTSGVAGNYVATITEGVPEVKPTVYEAGQMYSHANGGTSGGFYFTMNANEAPLNTDWSLRYTPINAEAIQRVRNGETTSIGNTGAETIVKYSETEYYVEGWAIGGLEEGDVLIVEGDFQNTANNAILRIEKTTVTYENGAFKFSTDPEPPTIHEAGQMYAHENGIGNNSDSEFAFYFRTDANDAAYNNDWSYEYGATSVDNIKLTRNGETISVAITGQGTIVRLNETDHYMKFVPWTTTGVLPVQEGDVFTISGTFKATSDETQQFNITETTVTYTNGALKYSTDVEVPDEPDQPDEPTIEAIEAGQMYSSTNGGTATGIYFTMAENALPFNEWNIEYKPVNADNVKITRNGETVSVGNVGAAMIVKFGATDYYFKTEGWLNSNFPLQDGDVLTIGGLFQARDEAKDYFTITETTIAYTNGIFMFSTDPEPPTSYEVGQMYTHTGGAVVTDNGGWAIHFTTGENDAPYNTDWTLEYQATMADNVKLTRGGETTSVANLGQGLIVKFSETEYCFKAEAWTLACGKDFQEGDVLTISGNFKNEANNAIIHITETTLTYANGAFKFSTDVEIPEEPEDSSSEIPEGPEDSSSEEPAVNVYEAGQMYAHENGIGNNSDSEFAFYFRTDANDAAYNSDWSYEYGATSVDNIKLTRNGETISVAITGQGTIVRLNETDHYMKFVPWTTTGVLPVQEGDVFTISGTFKATSDETQQFSITETTVTYTNGALKYSTDTTVDPDEPDQPDEPIVDAIEVGKMQSHTHGGNGSKGFYFTLAENALSYASDWSVEYTPVSEDVVKITRNGETINVGCVGLGTIVKFGATDYYFKAEAWMNGNYPLQEGDVLTISGLFRARDTETDYFTVAETTITYEYDLYQFSGEDKIEVIEAGYMYAHPYAGGSVTGVHFAMDANEATYNSDWSVEYSPLTESVIKLIRGGQTLEVGNPGAGTLVKFGESEYYIKAEAWINEIFPLQNGDVIVVDGLFKCRASEDIIKINASYIRVEEKVEGTQFKFLNPSVTFVNEDGTALDVIVYAYGGSELVEQPAEVPVKEMEGYTCNFLGWYNGENAWNFETDTVMTSVVLQAKFEMVANEYKASFVVDGETVDEIIFTIETMGELTLPAVPEKEGYTGTWDKTLEDVALEDITFTAVYVEVEDEPEDSTSSEDEPASSPVEDESTSSPVEDEPASSSNEKKESGCGSVISGMSAVLTAVAAAAIVLKKKKD